MTDAARLNDAALVVPVEAVSSLVIGTADVVTQSEQQTSTIAITGMLDAPLAAGDSVEIVLPGGQLVAATAAAGGSSFSASLSVTQAQRLGAGGAISAYVVDGAGDRSAAYSQSYAAASRRTIAPVTATPGDRFGSAATGLVLSGDGSRVAFDSAPTDGSARPAVYVEDLATGALTLVAASGDEASLSNDGHIVAYVDTTAGGEAVHLRNLDTGLDLLVSAEPGGAAAEGPSDAPSLSADGRTIVFESFAPDLVAGGASGEQVYEARVDGASVTVTLLSAPNPLGHNAPGSAAQGNGDSGAPRVSADGSVAVFVSNATNLLGLDNVATPLLNGSGQIYLKALTDNAATGLKAGSVVLISARQDGTPGNGGLNIDPVVSGNGRYVVFASTSNNLVPGVTTPTAFTEIYVKDLVTGAVRLVSDTADGTPADQGATNATISADGRTIVFESFSTNLLGVGDSAPDYSSSRQIYEKDLVTGAVTLLSEAGYTPGDQVSRNPSVSADGATVAFSSFADNLAPGAATSGAAAPLTEYGYVTHTDTSPSLTIAAPGATTTTGMAVFTGTIDAADAGQPILLTDPGDPGFTPVTAIVAATADPYVDRWSAAVAFTVGGTQTVTALVSGVSGATASAAASIGNAAAAAVTIDPVGGDNVVTAADLSDSLATTISGTASGAGGATLKLQLQSSIGALRPLGIVIVGVDGRWSLDVSNATLAANPSGTYAIVATVTNAAGATLRGATAITLTVPPATTLYDIVFTYKDGSHYTGTVAESGGLYKPGQTITAASGTYRIIGAAGTTTQASGTVTTSAYFDVTTAAFYTPVTLVAGTNGLGSESGSIMGPSGLVAFGDGVIEARLATATLYDFYFRYNDESYYYGKVAGGGPTYDYTVGQGITGVAGSYYIYGSDGATNEAPGSVTTSSYYDVTSAKIYLSTGHIGGIVDGSAGLGSELDSITGAGGTLTFGDFGGFEAREAPNTVYRFYFKYFDNSYYYGTIVATGSDGIYVGETIEGTGGYYYFYAQDGATALPDGQVTTSTYFDVTSGKIYASVDSGAGVPSGTGGIGSELDHINGAQGLQPFGESGLFEAREGPTTLYDFYFKYTDNSYYYGTVASGGTNLNYHAGQSIVTPRGFYYVYAQGAATSQAPGTVTTSSYFDISTMMVFTPVSHGAPSGTGGLGSELDHTVGAQGSQAFGQGGQSEARQAPTQLYEFYFKYIDGSYYYGTVADRGIYGYEVGQIANTPAGVYYIYSSTTTTDVAGTVRTSLYFDSTSGQTFVPVAYAAGRASGTGGLSSEVDATRGAQGLQNFGDGGVLEARQAPTTLYAFYFRYDDGSYYYGTVSAGLSFVYHLGQSLDFGFGGYYYIYANDGATKQAPGTVTTSAYFDSSSKLIYTPVAGGAGRASGSNGLGSELDSTTGLQGTVYFGEGGEYEAKQPADLLRFQFTFKDGSFYSGTVVNDAAHNYTPGQRIATAAGEYVIGADSGPTSVPPGSVYVDFYFDAPNDVVRYPTHSGTGIPVGQSGLGSELDTVVAHNGVLSTFGEGIYEAPTGSAILLTGLSNVLSFPHVFDGPIAGGMVGYLDPIAPPGIVRIDPAQPTATTDADGRYVLAAGTGPLIETGGVDTATGLAFTGTLEAPAGATVLSPVTTLIVEVARANGTLTVDGIAAAQTQVRTALGLPVAIDLTTYDAASILQDPLSSAADVTNAALVFKAGARLLDVEALIDAAGGSSATAIANVAAMIADNAAIGDVFAALASAGGPTPQAAAAVSGIEAANIAAVDAQLAGITQPTLIFDLISGSSIAQQGDTALALAADQGDFTNAVDTYVHSLDAVLAVDDMKAFTASVACYCPGTLILTTQGEIPVEALAIGDQVVTHDGAAEPIRWIGRRSYAAAFIAGNHLMLPVCIRAQALGAGRPRRNLWVSPGHAMLVDGQLVPAWRLLNGVSVVQAADTEAVSYFHIELDRHAVILAEGAPAESFLDDGCRFQFQNAHEYDRLYPDAPAMVPLQPRLEDGWALQALQERIAGRAGVVTPVEPIGALRGFVDIATPLRVAGWAQDADSPEEPVALEISAGGVPVLCVLANAYRADLRQAGLGSGCHAFDLALPPGLTGSVVVTRVTDGRQLLPTEAACAPPRSLAA